MSISINGRAKETGIKYFFGGEIGTMMAPGGFFMTSFKDIKSFLALHTPSNDLIRINPKKTVSESSIRRHLKLNDEEGISTLPNNELFENLSLMGYNILPNQRPSPGADETAFPTGDVRYGEAFPTDTSLDVGQDRENIAKTSAMPHEALPKEDALNTRRGLLDRYKSADKWSDNTDEMSNVLGSLGAANILDSGGLSKEKVLEQLSVHLARDLEAKFAREDQIIREQVERDSKIARIHAEKELEMMIAELDRSNKMVEKYLSEYEQAKVGLSHNENVELINELLIVGKDARFVPMNSKLESKRLKRPGIQLDKEMIKKLKTAEASGTEPTQEQQSEEHKELSEEELKKMMELVLVEELYIEALQSLVKENCSTTEVTDEKAKELWVELKRLYEPNSRDPLWALQRRSIPTADVYIAKKFATVERLCTAT
nr:hypothetical protein [Tanacetum cinerariifolium]